MGAHRRSPDRCGVDELLARKLADHHDAAALDKTGHRLTPAEREQAFAWARGTVRAARRLGLPLPTPQPERRPVMTSTALGTTAQTDTRARMDNRERSPEHRAAVVAGLRGLADLLDAHPQLRCPYSVRVSVSTIGDSPEAERAEVDSVAALLRVPVVDDRHYFAEKHFGPVAYVVAHIPDHCRRNYQSALSYQDNLAPGEQGA